LDSGGTTVKGGDKENTPRFEVLVSQLKRRVVEREIGGLEGVLGGQTQHKKRKREARALNQTSGKPAWTRQMAHQVRGGKGENTEL